ncbi:hypothetical protein V8C42DRAFT_312186 [Trichoderma barbatum]
MKYGAPRIWLYLVLSCQGCLGWSPGCRVSVKEARKKEGKNFPWLFRIAIVKRVTLGYATSGRGRARHVGRYGQGSMVTPYVFSFAAGHRGFMLHADKVNAASTTARAMVVDCITPFGRPKVRTEPRFDHESWWRPLCYSLCYVAWLSSFNSYGAKVSE